MLTTMLFPCAIAYFIIFSAAAPAPSPSRSSSAAPSTSTACQAKTFNQPWILSDITIYKASGQGSRNSHGAVSFHFCDENDGLQVQTDCSGTIINDRCEAENGGYVWCTDQSISFKLADDLIMLERVFVDDCLGPPPWNGGHAFGENNTKLELTTEPSGTLWSQEQMLVDITEMT